MTHYEPPVDLQRIGAQEQNANAALRESRRAALNLMQDAVAARRQVEQVNAELHASEQRYRALVDSSPDAIVVIQDGRFVFANPAALRLQGAEASNEVIGHPVLEVVHPDDREPVRERIERALQGGTVYLDEARVVRKDGQTIWVDSVGSPVAFNGRPAVQVILRDITERRRAEERLRLLNTELEQRLADLQAANRALETSRRAALNLIEDAVRARNEADRVGADLARVSEQRGLALEAGGLGTWDYRFDNGEVFWDERCRAMWGLPEKEHVEYSAAIAAIHPDDRAGVDEAVKLALAGASDGAYHREFRVVLPDSSLRWVASHGRVMFEGMGPARRAARFVGVNTDITDRKQKEEELRRFNRSLTALARSNEALARAKEESAYLQEVCQIVVKHCGHAMVWIGLAEDDEARTVRPVASAGFDEGYLASLNLTWADAERGRGPTGAAIRTGQPCGCPNMLTDPRFAPWRHQALQHGYASSIALPLRDAQRTFGALTIYSRQPNAFSENEVRLLSDLADDLANGITALRLRAAHAQAEAALGESEKRFRNMANAMPQLAWIARDDGHMVWFNRRWYEYTGTTPEQMEGWGWQTVPDPKALPQVLHQWKVSLATGHPFEMEFPLRGADGRFRQFLTRAHPMKAADGRLLQWFGTNTDITEQRQAQREREITIDFLRLVNSSTSLRALIQDATSFFQEQSACEAVGLRLKEGLDFPYSEAHGFPKEFILLENSLCSRDFAEEIKRDSAGNPVLECMCGNVICGRFDPAKPFFTSHGSFWTNSTTQLLASSTESDRQARTRNRCHGEGYESVALLPLRVGDDRLGLLQLNDRRQGLFSIEAIALWERLADHLAVALAKFKTDEALRESEARFRNVFDHAGMGIAITDRAGRFVQCNAAYSALTGYSQSELAAMEFPALIHPEDREHNLGCIRQLLNGEVPSFEIENRYLHKKGSLVWVHQHVSLLRDNRGQPACLVALVTDITVRRQTEEVFRFLGQCGAAGSGVGFFQELARYLAQALNMDFVCIDRLEDGLLSARTLAVFHDGRFQDNLSYSLKDTPCGDVVGQRICCFPRNVRQRFPKDSVLQEMRAESYLGATLWSAQGKPIGLIALIGRQPLADTRLAESVLQVVAVRAAGELERQESEEALRQSEARYRAIGESIDYGVWVCDADGRNIYASDSFLKLVGMTQEQCSNFGWGEVLHPDDAARTIAAWKERSRTGGKWDIEHRFRGVDGQYHHVLARGVPVRNERGEIVSWAGINLDISRLKLAEAALRRSNARLDLLAETASELLKSDAPQEVVERLCRKVLAFLDCDVFFNFLVDEPARRLQLNACAGIPPEDVARLQWLDYGVAVCGCVARDACRIIAEDIPTTPDPRTELIKSFGIRAYCCHPLMAQGKVIGTLSFGTRTRTRFTDEEIGLMSAVADQVAIAMFRQQTAQALRELSQRLTYHVDNSPLAVIEWGADMRLTRWSSEAERMFGWKAEEVLGKRMEDFRWIYPEDQPNVVEVSVGLRTGAAPRRFSANRNYRKDGSVAFCEWYNSSLLDESGSLRSILSLVLDVTARKQAELERHKFVLLADHSAEFIGICDMQFKPFYVNAAGLRLVGLESPEQAFRTPVKEFFFPEDQPFIYEEFFPRVMREGHGEVEIRFRHFQTGQALWMIYNVFFLQDADGRPVGLATVSRDITARKRAEERLTSSLHEKEVLLKEIHHRVKNNLQVISSLVSLQADALDNPTLRGVFQDVRDRVRSMALVHEILYRSENLARVDFAEYARNLLSYLWRAHASAAAAVRLNLDLQPVSLSIAAAVPCGLVLNELAANAFKHAFRGRSEGEVTVALRATPDGRVSLRVSDNGVGLPPGLDWRQSRSLGLQLVQMLTGQLNGTVETRAGVGTEFVLSFEPRDTQTAEAGEYEQSKHSDR